MQPLHPKNRLTVASSGNKTLAMNSATNRSHKKSPALPRKYPGFEEVYPLIAWLNHTTDEEGKGRVLGLLNAIRQVNELLKEPMFQKDGKYIDHYHSEPAVRYRALADEIILRCKRYSYMPWISPPINAARHKWNTVWLTAPDSEQWVREAKHKDKVITAMEETVGSESVAVRALIAAHTAEMLDKVIQCWHCHRWIFRKFKDQVACNTKCYQAEFKCNPEFKKERARKARERYHDDKARDEGKPRPSRTL